MMNKNTIITCIAIIVLIIPFAYSAMNIHAAEQMQYRWGGQGEFSFFELSNGGILKLCNTVPYAADFKNFQIMPYYDKNPRGTYHIESISLDGLQPEMHKGRFHSYRFVESQHLFMQMDFQFSGGDIRVDPSKMHVIVSIDTPIIGIIPHITSTQYSGFDFFEMMNKEC